MALVGFLEGDGRLLISLIDNGADSGAYDRGIR